jgi:hypothetical protein
LQKKKVGKMTHSSDLTEPEKIRLIGVILLVMAVIFVPHFIGCAMEAKEKQQFRPAVVHFTYKGHDYIKFGGTQVGYAHDPDCVCGKEIPTVEIEERDVFYCPKCEKRHPLPHCLPDPGDYPPPPRKTAPEP